MPPIDAMHLLAGAEAAHSQPMASAAAIHRALKQEPDNVHVRLAAYRFHFYLHEYSEASKHAHVLVEMAARRLNIPTDWRAVRPDDADFTAHEFAPGLFLQCLVAIGYCAARLGRAPLARDAFAKSVELDPTDRFGGGHLLGVIDRAGGLDDED
ncbi:hypothetical protein LA6_002243 [Marinibacterium anthonyi]|nr:hypothetical protein LA6_002243 [Marinibacterium anthonyi]